MYMYIEFSTMKANINVNRIIIWQPKLTEFLHENDFHPNEINET